MPVAGAREAPSGGLFSPGVLRQLDKENVLTPGVPGRTPSDKRRKNTPGFPVFQDQGEGPCPSASKEDTAPSELLATLKQTEREAGRLKEELHQARTSLKARNDRVQELKASTASANQRYTALVNSHEEATKDLGLLRAMAENSELLREERSSMEVRLAKREAVFIAVRNELAAAADRERGLREDLERAQEELATASQDASDRAEAQKQAEDGSGEHGRWTLQKAALDAQVSELEAQLAASGRRCAAVAAERAVLAEEATRREKEDGATVASLQDELQSLHKRTSADLGDWQRRHREALAAKKAAEGQLERLVGASKSIARVAEKQAVLEASLQEACELLSQTVLAEAAEGAAAEARQGSPERVVEGVLEHILGRVFEATRIEGGVGGGGEEGRREREAEQELRKEAVAMLEGTLQKLTAEMENLREFGVAEAGAFLEQAQSLEVELEGVRERHASAVSRLEASRAESEQVVEQLTQRLGDGDRERKELQVRLESATQELATTVQLSELALAARDAGEEGRAEEEARRVAAEAQRMQELEAQSNARREELESERRAYAEKADALEGENRALQEKLEGLSAQASALKARAAARDAASPAGRPPSPTAGVLREEIAARESKLREMEARLATVVAENDELEKKFDAVAGGVSQASPGRDERQAKFEALEAEVTQLRESVGAQRELLQKAKEDDSRMRKYVLHYSARSEQKMKEMQRRLARATARAAEEASYT